MSPYINLPPTTSELYWDLDRRIRMLETAYRFNAPAVNIVTNPPAKPNAGDMYYDTASQHLVYWNGIEWHKLNQSTY